MTRPLTIRLAAALLAAGTAHLAAAAPAAATAASPAVVADAPGLPSVFDLATKGGVMMVPIAIASLVALAIIVERLITLRRGRVVPANFQRELAARIPGGATGDDGSGMATRIAPAAAHGIAAWCRDQSNPAARVLNAGLRRAGSPGDIVERAAVEAGAREASVLRRRLRVLSVIAAVAPLMGLLGTILGMIDAFRTVASAGDALGRTELLAEGIYEAMITTAGGLMVAIPALLAYHWLSARVQRLVLELDAVVQPVVESTIAGAVPMAGAEAVPVISTVPAALRNGGPSPAAAPAPVPASTPTADAAGHAGSAAAPATTATATETRTGAFG
ncbi:MAG: MotA/TolQ/ExbB proton channel family protein [Phycisphaerales bacterium]